MATFTARDVQTLRQATGAGMLDAKRALDATGGDGDAARRWLREKGLASAGKRQDRASAEGAVALAVTAGGAAAVELRCETDFVAKSPDFVSLVDEIAQLVASKGESAGEERASAVHDLAVTLKENIGLGRVVHLDVPEGVTVGSYLHVQSGRGVNAVLVELESGGDELAHDLAVHIAFARPQFISRDEVPQTAIDAERATLETISRNEGKPEGALPKIVEGRLGGWFKERCLLDQAYVRDEKRTVAQLLGEARVVRFAQLVIGS